MPVRYLVDQARRLVIAVAFDRLITADLRDYLKALESDEGFDPEFDLLFDFTAVKDWSIESSQIQSLSRVVLFSETCRKALIAPADHVYGMLRMYQGYRPDRIANTRIFRNREEALAWLSLPPDIQLNLDP